MSSAKDRIKAKMFASEKIRRGEASGIMQGKTYDDNESVMPGVCDPWAPKYNNIEVPVPIDVTGASLEAIRKNLLIVCTSESIPVAYVRKSFVSENNKFPMSNARLLDLEDNLTFECNEEGIVVGKREMNNMEFAIDEISTYGVPPTEDFFGDSVNDIYNENEVKVEKVKSKFEGKAINVPLLDLARYNPRKARSIEDIDKIEIETSMDKLLRVALVSPSQFDEIFCVETFRPESPLMRRFLEKLSELVNEKLDGTGEEGIEDLKDLQKQAYKYAGYEGKTFETVIEEQKDYSGYFRYLLSKGEKIVISEEQRDYFKSLICELQKDKTYKLHYLSKKIDGETLEGMSVCSSPLMYFRGYVPNLVSGSTSVVMNYFFYIEDIKDIYDVIDKSNLSLQIALNNDLAVETYSKQVKTGVEFVNKIFVCDKNLNYTFFGVKKTTLSKWKNKLSNLFSSSVSFIAYESSKTAPQIVDFNL